MKRTVAEAKMTYFFGIVPIRLHLRNDLHIVRKLWHMLMGLLIVFCYMSGFTQGGAILTLGSILGVVLLVEMTRLRNPSFNEKMLRFWGPVMRAHEAQQMSTITHYVSSVILAILIFPKPVAILSILYLACGDPIASLFGILYGSKGPRFASGKTLIGTAAGVITCMLVTLIYLKTLSVAGGAILTLSILGGLVGGMAELLPFDIDDNFSIPVISGFVLWLGFMLVGL